MAIDQFTCVRQLKVLANSAMLGFITHGIVDRFLGPFSAGRNIVSKNRRTLVRLLMGLHIFSESGHQILQSHANANDENPLIDILQS